MNKENQDPSPSGWPGNNHCHEYLAIHTNDDGVAISSDPADHDGLAQKFKVKFVGLPKSTPGPETDPNELS